MLITWQLNGHLNKVASGYHLPLGDRLSLSGRLVLSTLFTWLPYGQHFNVCRSISEKIVVWSWLGLHIKNKAFMIAEEVKDEGQKNHNFNGRHLRTTQSLFAHLIEYDAVIYHNSQRSMNRKKCNCVKILFNRARKSQTK